MDDCLRVVVAGEVDSGKSTLIGRFLYEAGSLSKGAIEEIEGACQKIGRDFEFAYLLDSLEEEREYQLTIETTQVFCKTKRGGEFIFIDVPGHQELLRNMLSGSSYADIAILVVDAQKSVEAQTKRHAFILELLGIKQIILALNKMDLVSYDEGYFKRLRDEITDFFKKTAIQPKYFLPISAKKGENLLKESKNMGWYNGMPLIGLLNSCLKRRPGNVFRLPIQDVYSINGKSAVVGSILSGEIRNGENVTALPSNKEYRVRKIRFFNKDINVAQAPLSIGLIFDNGSDLKRGQIICKPELPEVATGISAKIFCVHPFNIKRDLRFRCATQETTAQIGQINGIWDSASLEPKCKGDKLEEADMADVVIATKDPMVVEAFQSANNLGRFVLKENNEICAVGVIL